LQKGVNIEAMDAIGMTSLMKAASMGGIEVVRLRLDKGANIEATDNSGATVLLCAAEVGKADMVKLLAKGANIESKDIVESDPQRSNRASGAIWPRTARIV
jgi:ankyrin repeat protein